VTRSMVTPSFFKHGTPDFRDKYSSFNPAGMKSFSGPGMQLIRE